MRHKKRNRAARGVLISACVVMAALLVLLVIVCTQVFRVRSIQIVGNRNLLQEEVITQSGVQLGEHLWNITASGLRGRLEENRYIEYERHSFDYRGTLTIHIRERQGRALVRALGLYYVLDESGMVLECAGEYYPTNIAAPNIEDLAQRSNTQVIVGEKFPVKDEAQLEAMQQVLLALDETGLLAGASALNVKNLDNLYYMTSEKTRIELGDTQNLVTKLRTAREVLSIRESSGNLRGAKIDVSTVGKAHFIPADLPTPTPVPTATPTIAPQSTAQR